MYPPVAQMQGYLIPDGQTKSMDDIYRYVTDSRDAFMLKHLAMVSGFEAYITSPRLNEIPLISSKALPIRVVYVPIGMATNIENIRVPYAPKDFSSFSTCNIEAFHFANSIDQYFTLAMMSRIGTLEIYFNEKMFPYASYEELLIAADLSFDDVCTM